MSPLCRTAVTLVWLTTIVADSVVAGIEPGARRIGGWRRPMQPATRPSTTSVDDQLSVEVWVDVDGNRVPISIITSLSGAEHCGWQSVTYLSYEDRYYISDPGGVMDTPFVAPFDQAADLPPDAVDTGYRHDGRELWISTDETVAFLVTGERVEAWPSPDSAHPPLCARGSASVSHMEDS